MKASEFADLTPDEIISYFPGFTVYDAETGEKASLGKDEFFAFDEDGLLFKIYPNNADFTFDDIPKEGKYVISFRNGTYMRW